MVLLSLCDTDRSSNPHKQLTYFFNGMRLSLFSAEVHWECL